MNTKGMTKYLIMVMLMTAISIPLFIYSRSFLKANHGDSVDSAQANDGAESAHMTQDSKLSPASPATSENPSQEPALEDLQNSRPEPPPLANLYRPPLLGKCKKLFEHFMRQSDPEKPYRAFVYSFNGETAYCAGAVTDKSQEKAEEIAKRDCEENQAHSGKYSPCRIYTSEETN